MKDKKTERIYVDPEFRKYLEMKKIESGERSIVAFTKKAAINPKLLNGEPMEKKKLRKKGGFYEPLF